MSRIEVCAILGYRSILSLPASIVCPSSYQLTWQQHRCRYRTCRLKSSMLHTKTGHGFWLTALTFRGHFRQCDNSLPKPGRKQSSRTTASPSPAPPAVPLFILEKSSTDRTAHQPSRRLNFWQTQPRSWTSTRPYPLSAATRDYRGRIPSSARGSAS